ncbi:MAG: pyridoxal phosphate-dependent aminotransferase family protein [Elusimicrobia bacterium]|nr:pyridoxal phosphate-dependent aminotransferase family protein [Elusimicrobiota bacterium]
MSDLFEKCFKFTTVRDLQAVGLFPYFTPIESSQEPEVTVRGKRMIMLGTNNYLGLSTHPRMRQAAIEAVEKYGTGCAGSRFLNGNLDLHQKLEEKLARFKHREAALLFATGYQANLGIVGCLLGKNDILIADKLDHASILDGGRLSYGQVERFKHNDPDDLERTLQKIPRDKGKLIVVDGVFSMEGDICPLPQVVELAKRYRARLMVDDAHGTGVLGKDGRGTCEHFGLEDSDVDLIMGTCSKSLASVGGFVCGSKDIVDFLRYQSRSMIFSAALPPAQVAAISTAIDIILEEPERRANLWANAENLRKGFKGLGFDTNASQTPIIPIIIGEDIKTFQLWKLLFDNGIFVNPVVSPATPPGRGLIRTSVMATHTEEQIDRALDIFKYCAEKLSLLPSRSPKALENAVAR